MTRFTRFLVATSLLSFSTVVRAGEKPTEIQFVRPLGMGGAFTAIADDHNIFSFNPAGLVQRTGAQVTLFEVAVGGSKDLKDAYDFINDNEDDITNMDDLPASRQVELINEIDATISKLNPRVYVAADVASFVSGPKFLGLPVHAGFGAFGVVDASFELRNGAIYPEISYQVNNDVVLPFSLAKRFDMPFLPGRIGIGATAKLIRRTQAAQENISVLQLDTLDAPPMAVGTGIGSDLGVLYQPTERTNVGVMVQDFLGTKMHFDSVAAEDGFEALPERDTVIRPRTNLGVAVTPNKLLWLLPTNDRWTFAADVRDVFPGDNEHVFFEDGFKHPFGDNLPTHLHLGAEFRYWFLRFRGGAYQGYPTLGLGVDIPFLKIDYAFYSRELGVHAGDIEEENHVISLALRFGSGATESRERIQKAKEKGRIKGDAAPESTDVAPATEATPQAETPAATPVEAPAEGQ